MKISNNGLNLIAQFEGCRLTAYKDVVGIWTIGYGQTKNVRAGQKITEAQAKELLRSDISGFENSVNNYITNGTIRFTPTQNQFDALVSFAYNLGAGRIKTLCEGRTPEQVADGILQYNKAGGRVIQGLVNRRNKERELFLKDYKATKENKESKVTVGVKDSNPYAQITGSKILKKGSKGDSVKWLQWHLKFTFKYDVKIDGDFGISTENAVKKFQKDHKLPVDGVVGKNTIKALISK